MELNPIAETSFVVWSTYASNGASRGVEGQRWYTGQGRFVPGARTLPLTLYETTGSVVFGWDDGSGFIPSITQTVGTATMTFFDCHAARLAFAFTQNSNDGVAGLDQSVSCRTGAPGLRPLIGSAPKGRGATTGLA